MALEFKIELSGNFAGALEKDAQASEKAEGATKKHRHELELFEGEIGKAKAGLAGFELNLESFGKGGSLFTFDLAEGLHEVVDLAGELAEKVIDLGKEFAHAAGDAQDLSVAIKLDVGEEGGEKIDKLAESFAGSRFSAKGIKEALLPLIEESGDELSGQWNDLVTAATDVSVRRKGKTSPAAALEALRGIEIQPQKIRGSLKELGIRQKDFYEDLGDLLGISADSAEKQTKAGAVKAQTLLSVALHQIAEREGGALGNATNEGSKTLGASLERIAHLKDTLFERAADSPGIQALTGFLNNFIDTLEGPIGTELVAKLSSAFETLFGDLSGPAGLDKMRAGITRAAKAVEDLIGGFQAAWPTIKSTLEELPAVLNEIVILAEEFAVVWTANKLVNGVSAFASVLQSQGVMGGITNLRNGLNAALSPVAALTIAFEAWRYAFEKISETVKELGGLHQVAQDFKDWIGGNNDSGVAHDSVNENSPAWKKARAANNIPTADNIPMFAEGGIVNRPTLGVFGEAGPEAIVPLGKLEGIGGGTSITYAPAYSVSGGANAAEVQAQLEQFDRLARLEFARIISELREA